MQGPSSFTSHHHREVWQGLVGEGEHLPHVEPKLSKPRNPPKTCQTQQLVSGILKVNKSRGALNAQLVYPTQRHLPVPPKSEMIRPIRQCAWCQGERSAVGQYHRLTRCGRAPANGAGRLCRRSQSQVIVGGTLIRRSSGEVTRRNSSLVGLGLGG